MDIILASKSAPRKKALEILGLTYRVIPSSINEKLIRDNNPITMAKKLTEAKVRQVGDENNDSLIIGGDLIVYFNGNVYEKPADIEEAKSMLKSFSGKWLSIIGGIAVFNPRTNKLYSAAEEYKVKFRELSSYEIDDYVRRYPALNCAGAFEGDGLFRFAEVAEGSYPFTSQITFPLNRLIEFLREEGVQV
ncbi:MAG: Maf family nucleotide pyrophosphatase [Nanoarchaeota archaeon]|nr:Maf family nucleotide pyrophosphatase [Nanoarchaeota archaeon]